MNLEKNNYRETILVYMTILVKEDFLDDKGVLLDNFTEVISILVNDYLTRYDQGNMSLLDSISKYLDLKRNVIKSMLRYCVD